MTPHELIVAAGVAIAAAAYLCGSLAPWWRVLEWAHRDYLDDIADRAYEEGRADERNHGDPFPTVVWDDDDGCVAPSSPVRAGYGEKPGSGHPHDWRADYAEQLAPAVLDAENLPGPTLPAPDGARARAGELHEEFPLPAILHLGAEYDGGDQTFARVQLRQMTAINRHEAARKALLDECGVPWVPMEMIAA